jgi:hypothetical protein
MERGKGGRKHHQFRNGKINLVIKKDEMAFIHDPLSSQGQKVTKLPSPEGEGFRK